MVRDIKTASYQLISMFCSHLDCTRTEFTCDGYHVCNSGLLMKNNNNHCQTVSRCQAIWQHSDFQYYETYRRPYHHLATLSIFKQKQHYIRTFTYRSTVYIKHCQRRKHQKGTATAHYFKVSTEQKLKFQPKFQKNDFFQHFGQKNALFSTQTISFDMKFQPLKMRSDYCHKVLNDLKISNKLKFPI